MLLALICVAVFLPLTAYSLGRYFLAYRNFMRKIKKIPSTKCHPIVGHMWDFLFASEKEMFILLRDLVQRSAASLSVIWIGPIPIVSLIKPEHVQEILNSTDCIEKPFQYSFLAPWLGEGLLIRKASKWQARRKMLTPAFHFSILESFLEVFAEKSQILVKRLNKEVGSDCFDAVPYVSACALDIISETAMGVQVNAQEENINTEYFKAVKRTTDSMARRVRLPWYYLDFIYYMTPTGKQFKKDVNTIQDVTRKIVRERKLLYKKKKMFESDEVDDLAIGIKKKRVFLDLLLEASEDGKVLTDEEIREEVDTFMFEGHDTVASVMSFSLRLLGTRPDIQDKMFKELEDIFQESDRAPTLKDIHAMKYVEMVIKECLRLYPSVPVIGRIPATDIEIDGYTIPAGSMISTGIYLTHRDPIEFPNPDEFNPENFLPEKVAKRHPYAFIPFSAGPRNCIGQKFGLMEMKVMMSYIIRNYKLEAAGEDPILLFDIILNSDNGVQIKITSRAS